MTFTKSMGFSEDREFLRADYRTTTEFKLYAVRVVGVLANSKKPLTMGDIHRKLKAHANDRWTADVLDVIGVDHVGVLPTRYRLRPRSGK